MKNILLILVSVLFAQVSYPQAKTSAQTDGFKVFEMQEGSIYEKLGLKQGDVIKSYNGKPVNSVQESMVMYDKCNKSQLNLNALRIYRFLKRENQI